MADGRVLLNVPAEFDLDGDGQIGPHEATLLVTGGIDTGTLLPLATPLLAPGGSQVATLAVRLSQTLGLSAADAGDAILQHFGLSSEVDLFSVDAIASSLAGDLNGSAVEAVVIQVQSTAVQIGRLLSGTSAVSLSHAALAAFDALAARIGAGEAASLGESVAVEALAGAAAARLAVTLPSEQLAAAAAVIAEGNRRIAELPLAADLPYLQHLKAIQAVALQAVAGDLELLGAGQLPVADLVARHTGQALDVQIAAAEIGSIVPPAVSILDAVPLPISTTGSVIHEFSVALSQRAALPVIVQYETFVAAGNVQWLPPIAGSFTIAPGQTQATIAIPVDMTEVPSHQAVYFVRLTTSEHATLGQPITTGTFDGPAQIVLAELPAAAVTTQPLTLLAAWTDLPGQTHTATIDWGDGTVEPAVLEQGAAGASLEIRHAYAQPGDYRVLVHVADAAGNESSAELPVEIRRWLLAPDPESPGKSVLVIGGTPGNDHIQVLAQKKKGQRLRPRVGGESLGQFQSAALSRLVVFAGEGNDRIKIARSLALPAEVHAGEGNNRVDGGRGATWITAGGGNDRLRTGAGHDRIEAGGGNDLVLDGPGNDFIDGGPGSDQLAGGAGDDLLLGGPGSDLLLGGPGDDLLIGGLDADLLSGNRGDDLVIAGSTHYDDNEEALALLAAEWHAARMAAARIANLSTGTGPVLAGTGIRLIHGTTVADDQAHDLVFNSQGEDWIIVDWRTRCCRRSKSRRTAAFSNLAEWEGT